MQNSTFQKIIPIILMFSILALGVVMTFSKFIPSRMPNTSAPMSIPTNAINVPRDFQIKLVRGVCFGFCPAYKLTVNVNGTVEFDPENFTQVKQLTKYQIGLSQVSEIYREVDKINFFQMNDKYVNNQITDLPSTSIEITANGQTKKIEMYGLKDTVPEVLTKLGQKIDEITGSINYVGRGANN